MILSYAILFGGLFLIFLLFRNMNVVNWRSEVRDAVLKYNFNLMDDMNTYWDKRIDSEDVLYSFNYCWNKFWVFGKFSMMKPEYIEILKSYFN